MDEELKELLKDFVARQESLAVLLIISLAGSDHDLERKYFDGYKKAIEARKSGQFLKPDYDPFTFFKGN